MSRHIRFIGPVNHALAEIDTGNDTTAVTKKYCQQLSCVRAALIQRCLK